MNVRPLCALFLVLFAGPAGIAFAADRVPLSEMTAPWLELLQSRDAALRNAAATSLINIVQRYPAAADELIQRMAFEVNQEVLAEHDRRLAKLAKESPATVSALIRLIRDRGTNYRVRKFGEKVLSQAGPAAATPEFVEALAETYCPVPGAFIRILRSLGKDAAPVLIAGFRHPNMTVRNRAIVTFQMIGRTEPAIQKLFENLQAEAPLQQKLREGPLADRVVAVVSLAELARTTPGVATGLVRTLKDVSDNEVLIEAENQLVSLGRESPEAVVALLASIRSRDSYRARKLAIRVLPKMGAMLNRNETLDALGDDYCPVPGMMRNILIKAGSDVLPILADAAKHPNPEVREAAWEILDRLPKAAVVGP